MAIIVSGCPRSGTSVMMDCMREIFGDDNIKGSKFPQENRSQMREQQEGEEDQYFAIRKYVADKHLKDKPDSSYEDMNPNGFWECQYSVQGIKYNFQDREDLKTMEVGNLENAKVVKVVSQGLLSSDPKYIDKIVYMIRHPRAVAKSQERLKRGFDTKFPDGEVRNIFDGLTIHTPEMYIAVTVQACRWLLANSEIPVHFVLFDELMTTPKERLAEIGEFLGTGDFTKAYGVVEPKLNRSIPEDIPHDLWEDAEFVYDNFVSKNYQEVLDYFDDPKRSFNREKRSWSCPRYGQQVTERQCKLCRSSSVVRENFKTFAMQKMIDWENEPCFFEVGTDLDREEYLTIKDSIKQNFWVNELWLGINDVHLDDLDGSI
jgi:hypothetical protein